MSLRCQKDKLLSYLKIQHLQDIFKKMQNRYVKYDVIKKVLLILRFYDVMLYYNR